MLNGFFNTKTVAQTVAKDDNTKSIKDYELILEGKKPENVEVRLIPLGENPFLIAKYNHKFTMAGGQSVLYHSPNTNFNQGRCLIQEMFSKSYGLTDMVSRTATEISRDDHNMLFGSNAYMNLKKRQYYLVQLQNTHSNEKVVDGEAIPHTYNEKEILIFSAFYNTQGNPLERSLTKFEQKKQQNAFMGDGNLLGNIVEVSCESGSNGRNFEYTITNDTVGIFVPKAIAESHGLTSSGEWYECRADGENAEVEISAALEYVNSFLEKDEYQPQNYFKRNSEELNEQIARLHKALMDDTKYVVGDDVKNTSRMVFHPDFDYESCILSDEYNLDEYTVEAVKAKQSESKVVQSGEDDDDVPF